MSRDTTRCIGQVVREQRQALGFSLHRLSEEIGISASALSQIETGLFKPAHDTLCKIIEFLKLDPRSLFSQDYEPPEEELARGLHSIGFRGDKLYKLALLAIAIKPDTKTIWTKILDSDGIII